jgi:hypothetical protein
MSHVDNTLGNILIKHNDKWRGDYYLKEDLTFTVNKSQAARFYLLKPGDTTIINGDRISVNSGNRTLVINSANEVKLLDRDLVGRDVTSFIITNGTENTDPITYETTIFLVSDKNIKTALRYEWGWDPSMDLTLDNSQYKPKENPNLSNGSYSGITETHIGLFRLSLEKADGAITTVESARNMVTLNEPAPKHKELPDGYKGAVLIILLMVILILCIMISK